MTRPNQWDKVNREQAKKSDKTLNVEQVPYSHYLPHNSWEMLEMASSAIVLCSVYVCVSVWKKRAKT